MILNKSLFNKFHLNKSVLLLLFLLLSIFLCSLFLGSDLSAKPHGQFYSYLLSARFNSGSLVGPRAVGFGLFVVAGDSEKVAHLADFGYSLSNLDSRESNDSFGLANEFQLGYVYHWSNNYDREEKSNNVHIGFGFVTKLWEQNRSGFTSDENNNLRFGEEENRFSSLGNYFRIAYFASLPASNGNPLIIGFNLGFKFYSTGTVASCRKFETDPEDPPFNPLSALFSVFLPNTFCSEASTKLTYQVNNVSQFNATELSFLIGTQF